MMSETPETMRIRRGSVGCQNSRIDTREEIIGRVEQALEFVEPERLMSTETADSHREARLTFPSTRLI